MKEENIAKVLENFEIEDGNFTRLELEAEDNQIQTTYHLQFLKDVILYSV